LLYFTAVRRSKGAALILEEGPDLGAGSVDHIEYGTYVARLKTAPLAVKD
jgi:hypothetical protein